MSVLLTPLTVTLMLPVTTLLVASPVPVTRDSLEMDRHAQVGGASDVITHISDIDECITASDNCDTIAACANTPGT